MVGSRGSGGQGVVGIKGVVVKGWWKSIDGRGMGWGSRLVVV